MRADTEQEILKTELWWTALVSAIVTAIMLAIIYAGVVHHINPPSNIETIDPKTLQLIDTEERFDYQKIHDPMWTAVDVARNFTPEQLAGQVEKFVERASSRALREAIGVVTVTDPKAVGDPKAAPPVAPGKP